MNINLFRVINVQIVFKKEFQWTKERVELLPLVLPENLSVSEALRRVLRLPSVASKRYLTNKVMVDHEWGISVENLFDLLRNKISHKLFSQFV